MKSIVCFVFATYVMSIIETAKSGHKNVKDHNVYQQEPQFAAPINNLTVITGKDAKLTCVVHRIGNYKVAWVKVDTQTILTIHYHVITRNYRISASHENNKRWHLHINNVQEADTGFYMCQINTVPMKSQVGYLDVVRPTAAPTIVASETSAENVVASEGDNVTLTCKAVGHPPPYIMWRREDGLEIALGNRRVDTADGERLQFIRVTRRNMGSYLCIASNGVPPTVSKRIQLQVQFPPQMTIPNELVGGFLGGSVGMECFSEAFPKTVNYWTWFNGSVLSANDKYEISLTDDGYRIQMRLVITDLQIADFGHYRCVSKNFLGVTDGMISLYELNGGSSDLADRSLSLPGSVVIAQVNPGRSVTVRKTNDAYRTTTRHPNALHEFSAVSENVELDRIHPWGTTWATNNMFPRQTQHFPRGQQASSTMKSIATKAEHSHSIILPIILYYTSQLTGLH